MKARNPIIALLCCTAASVAACSKDSQPAPQTAQDAVASAAEATPPKEPPPAPGEPKDISFPEVGTLDLDNGLQVNTIVADQLPVVYATLVVRSGSESDPSSVPGLSGLVAQMLKEGTTKRSSAALKPSDGRTAEARMLGAAGPGSAASAWPP